MSVKQILDRKGGEVATVQPETPVADVMRLLARRRIGAVVVTDADGMVRGIVSERDIVREMAESGPDVLGRPVSGVMTRAVISCGRHDVVDDLLAVMTHGHFRHMPVVEGGRLVGIVSIGDLVHFRIHSLEQETRHLHNYIAAAG